MFEYLSVKLAAPLKTQLHLWERRAEATDRSPDIGLVPPSRALPAPFPGEKNEILNYQPIIK